MLKYVILQKQQKTEEQTHNLEYVYKKGSNS